MTISREEVEHVAYLARLGLSEEDKERLRDQLSSILDNMVILGELDTAAIPPTAHVIPQRTVMRPDVVVPGLTHDQVLANAPETEEGFLRILPVFEEDYDK